MSEHDELLRAALRAEQADPHTLGFSSIAAVIADSPHHRDIYLEETAPEQVQLDLHLGGEGVFGSATRADFFSRFVGNIEKAVDSTAHHLAGRRRNLPELLISGALPGSVRVVLQVPDTPPAKNAGGTGALFDPTSVLSQAVRSVAGVLAAAAGEDSPDDDPLLASTQSMPRIAKAHLTTLARTAERAHWIIEGTVTQRHHSPERFRVERRGVQRLATALSAEVGGPEREILIGRLDGVRYSLSTLWLIPASGTRALAISVPTADLLDEAAALNAAHALVRVEVDVYRAVTQDGGTMRTSRALVSITAEPEATVESGEQLTII